MKVLTVAIPNHHFFQWVNQLKDSGYEVFWFDITDGGAVSQKISWVTQIKGWKLRWDYPLRTTVKRKLPNLYKWIQKKNEHNVADAFAKALHKIQPDIVHCFEMQLAGLPIFSILTSSKVPLIYSSWGSDLFDFKRLGVTQEEATTFLNRVDYLITDCNRDFGIALKNGFKGAFLGVFPGNGGLELEKSYIQKASNRNTILIKGYEDGVGKASIILEALTLLKGTILENINIIVYSADRSVEAQINASEALQSLDIDVFSRFKFVKNEELLRIMGNSSIHIANSLSDGMPNALLEAMGMGAFPIQSNPGGATEEVITDGKNGFLIQNPLDAQEIAMLMEKAINALSLRISAQEYNTTFINVNYNRSTLREQIIALYQKVFNNYHS